MLLSAFFKYVELTGLVTYSTPSPRKLYHRFVRTVMRPLRQPLGQSRASRWTLQCLHTLCQWLRGGAALPSLRELAPASYLGAFFRVTGPLTKRLALMGGTTTTRAATLLADPEAASATYAWAAFLTAAHREAIYLQDSVIGPELHIISLVAPRANII